MAQNQIVCPKCKTKINIDQEVIVQRIRDQIKNEAKKEQEAEWEVREKELKEQANESLQAEKSKRKEAEENELKLRKKQEEVAEKEKNIDLIVARKIEEQNQIIQEKTLLATEEKFKLIIAEKDKKIEDQKKLNDEMNRKLHQGSMQTQGEVLELSFEEELKKNYHTDKIEPVPKGISGVDIIQIVVHNSGQTAGIIAWETKRTKNWEDGWVEKAKDDSRNIKADICVIVSENLPQKIKYMGEHKGIWVCNFASALGVAGLLRHGILIKFNTVLVNTGKDEKKEAIYDYLCSPLFKQKVDIIIENSQKFLEIIETEKRWMTKKWAVQETRIRRLQDNTLKMYGEVQGIAGSSLPELDLMELEEPEEKSAKTPDDNQTNLF